MASAGEVKPEPADESGDSIARQYADYLAAGGGGGGTDGEHSADDDAADSNGAVSLDSSGRLRIDSLGRKKGWFRMGFDGGHWSDDEVETDPSRLRAIQPAPGGPAADEVVPPAEGKEEEEVDSDEPRPVVSVKEEERESEEAGTSNAAVAEPKGEPVDADARYTGIVHYVGRSSFILRAAGPVFVYGHKNDWAPRWHNEPPRLKSTAEFGIKLEYRHFRNLGMVTHYDATDVRPVAFRATDGNCRLPDPKSHHTSTQPGAVASSSGSSYWKEGDRRPKLVPGRVVAATNEYVQIDLSAMDDFAGVRGVYVKRRHCLSPDVAACDAVGAAVQCAIVTNGKSHRVMRYHLAGDAAGAAAMERAIDERVAAAADAAEHHEREHSASPVSVRGSGTEDSDYDDGHSEYSHSVLAGRKYEHKFIDSHCHIDFLMDRCSDRATEDICCSTIMERLNTGWPPSFGGYIANFIEPYELTVEAKKDTPFEAILRRDVGLWRGITVGCHPHAVAEWSVDVRAAMDVLLRSEMCVAVGECGLDRSKKNSSHFGLQKEVFRQQVQLAAEHRLSLVVHCRPAEQGTAGSEAFLQTEQAAIACIRSVEAFADSDLPIHRHCYTGDYATACQWRDAFGATSGAAGSRIFFGLTPFALSPVMDKFVTKWPLNQLLLETDSPFFPVKGYAREDARMAKYSHPGVAIQVAGRIARLRRLPVDAVLAQLWANTMRCYPRLAARRPQLRREREKLAKINKRLQAPPRAEQRLNASADCEVADEQRKRDMKRIRSAGSLSPVGKVKREVK